MIKGTNLQTLLLIGYTYCPTGLFSLKAGMTSKSYLVFCALWFSSILPCTKRSIAEFTWEWKWQLLSDESDLLKILLIKWQKGLEKVFWIYMCVYIYLHVYLNFMMCMVFWFKTHCNQKNIFPGQSEGIL